MQFTHVENACRNESEIQHDVKLSPFFVSDRLGHDRHVELEPSVPLSKASRGTVEEQGGPRVRPRVRPVG